MCSFQREFSAENNNPTNMKLLIKGNYPRLKSRHSFFFSFPLILLGVSRLFPLLICASFVLTNRFPNCKTKNVNVSFGFTNRLTGFCCFSNIEINFKRITQTIRIFRLSTYTLRNRSSFILLKGFEIKTFKNKRETRDGGLNILLLATVLIKFCVAFEINSHLNIRCNIQSFRQPIQPKVAVFSDRKINAKPKRKNCFPRQER